MKNPVCLLIFLISFTFIYSQERKYLDEKGDTISNNQFESKWRNDKLGLSAWSYIGNDGNNYTKLKSGRYLTGTFDYARIKNEIETITPLKLADSSIILIEYYYKDDLCTLSRDNKWTKEEINNRKAFLDPIKKKLNEEHIFYICLFENGMTLRNKSSKKSEYFFLDNNNYFKNHLFSSSTLCGSFAAIKPNGQTLIRNGEYRADLFAKYLTPLNWSLIFNQKNKKEPVVHLKLD